MNQDIRALVKSDPAPFIQAIRTGLDRAQGPGYAILPTHSFLSASAGKEIFEALTLRPSAQNGIYFLPTRPWSNRDGTPSPQGQLLPGQMEALLGLARWVERVIRAGMPVDEPVRVAPHLAVSNLRRQIPANYAPEAEHADGCYMRVVGSFLDLGPVCLHGGKTTPVSRGDLMVFSGTVRHQRFEEVVATIHRSPSEIIERILFALSFEPLFRGKD
jgi:hypothetical protein